MLNARAAEVRALGRTLGAWRVGCCAGKNEGVTIMATTFAKLRSGDWGVRVTGDQQTDLSGQTVTVSKRDGSTKQVELAVRVASGPDYALYATAPRAPRASRNVRGGGRRGYSAPSRMCEDAPCCGCCGPQADGGYFDGMYDY